MTTTRSRRFYTTIIAAAILIPGALAVIFQRLSMISLYNYDPLPLAQYRFAINFGSVAVLGFMWYVTFFYYLWAWPWLESRPGLVKFLGIYIALLLGIFVASAFCPITRIVF
jgi:hypothetical protein